MLKFYKSENLLKNKNQIGWRLFPKDKQNNEIKKELNKIKNNKRIN